MKKTKVLAAILALVCVFSSFAIFSTGAQAAGAWDGQTADVGWYLKDPKATAFTVSNGEELYAMSLICQACDIAATPTGENKVYYDSNNKVILDSTKITPDTKCIDFTSDKEGAKFRGKTVKLGADIDLGGKTFVPIGSTGSFKGTFDGANHKVSNFNVDANAAQHKKLTTQYYYGLFAFIANNSIVKDLTVENVVLDVKVAEGTSLCLAGGIVAAVQTDASAVKNCKVNGVKINFVPEEGFMPANNTSCLLGAAIGRSGSSQEMNIVVTGFEFVGSESDKYNQSEDVLYGGLANTSVIPNFKDSTVTYKDGKMVTVGAGSSETKPPVDIPPPIDEFPEDVEKETKAPETKAQDSAPVTAESDTNTTVIIIIAAVAAAIVIAVVAAVIIKKKKA